MPRIDCDETPGRRDKDGYVEIMRHGRRQRAHRWAWEDANGPIPEGKLLRHKCDNPPCRNVAHLELGTQAQNVEDRDARGRTARRERHGMAKLTPAQVEEVRAATGTQDDIARRYGISQSQVSRIRLKQGWK